MKAKTIRELYTLPRECKPLKVDGPIFPWKVKYYASGEKYFSNFDAKMHAIFIEEVASPPEYSIIPANFSQWTVQSKSTDVASVSGNLSTLKVYDDLIAEFDKIVVKDMYFMEEGSSIKETT